ncbi:MAG: helix-turn-helix transcriptional regulator [Acidimicrobiales bacterium]
MTRPGSVQRLSRLLAIVPWVVANDGPAVTEVCKRFGISERDLLADLNLLFMCGVYPYTPDALIEVDVEDGRVWIRFAEWFRRPLRLTPLEALALVAAARAGLGMAMAYGEVTGGGAGRSADSAAADNAAGDSALARALAKLGLLIGISAEEGLDVVLGDASAEVLASLQRALAQKRKVRLWYYSFGRDETGARVVQPWRVFSSEGQWYLQAWCEKAQGERLFRVDRARSVVVLDEHFEPPVALRSPRSYEAKADDPLVVLDLRPRAHWVAERYPNEGVEDKGGGVLRVALRASSQAWLGRLLLRAGPDATVVKGAEGVAQAAARRLLAIYNM